MTLDITIKQASFRDGSSYAFERWVPLNPKGVILFVHDVGANAASAAPLVHPFLELGYAVALYDQRGHGKSAGQRYHIDHFTTWVDDLEEYIQQSREALGVDLPLFLIGEGVGILTALSFAMSRPIKVSGIISLSGFFESAQQLPHWKEKYLRKLTSFAPTLRLRNVGKRISLQAFHEIERTAELTMPQALKLRTPVLLFHGSDDDIAAAGGSKAFAGGLLFPEKKMNIVKGGGHFLLRSEHGGEILSTMQHWVEERVRQHGTSDVQTATIQQESLWG